MTSKKFLETELEMGIGFHNPAFVELCNNTARMIADSKYNIVSVLDYGGGTGVYSKAFHQYGFDVAYYDKFKEHVAYLKEHCLNPSFAIQPCISIVKTPITTDLMLFIEVAEHMTDKEIATLFSKIKPKYILFSSTSTRFDGDIDWGHINVKQQDEWIKLFDEFGYSLQKETNIPTSWSKIFKLK